MKEKIDDMVIVGRGEALNGDKVVSFFYKNQADLRRIAILDYEDQVIDFKREFIKKYGV